MLAVFGPDVAPAAARDLAAAFAIYQDAVESIDLAHLLGLPAWVPTPQSRRARRAARDIRALIEDLLRRHALTAPFARFAAARRDDGGAVLDHAALVDEIGMMLLAGSETSANALAWALYLAASHAPTLDRLRAEWQAVLGDGRAPEAADLPALVFTRAVVQETLRLYPPVAILSRQAMRADRIRRWDIRKGGRVACAYSFRAWSACLCRRGFRHGGDAGLSASLIAAVGFHHRARASRDAEAPPNVAPGWRVANADGAARHVRMTWLAWSLGGFSLLISLGFLLLSIWHLRRLRRAGADRAGKVSLVLALRGDQPGLAALFAALAAQEFCARRLILAVESAHDPALAQTRALAGMLPFPLEYVIAGEAEATAQKCANLAAAMALIDQHDDAVVVLDGDIRPQAYWLGCLVGPILDGRYDIVTGYRWLQPGGAGWMAQAIAWLDHAVALLPRLKGITVLWGGSTAYSAAALRPLDLPRLYARQLVDDL